MKRKAFIRNEINIIISRDYPCLVPDKTVGMACYRYQNNELDLKKRYYLSFVFDSYCEDCFSFECSWLSDMSSNIPTSHFRPKSLSASKGCLRIGFLAPEILKQKPHSYQVIIPKSYEYRWPYGFGVVDEEIKLKLECILNDVADKIGRYAIPFLEDLARFHSGQSEMSPNLLKIDERLGNPHSLGALLIKILTWPYRFVTGIENLG